MAVVLLSIAATWTLVLGLLPRSSRHAVSAAVALATLFVAVAAAWMIGATISDEARAANLATLAVLGPLWGLSVHLGNAKLVDCRASAVVFACGALLAIGCASLEGGSLWELRLARADDLRDWICAVALLAWLSTIVALATEAEIGQDGTGEVMRRAVGTALVIGLVQATARWARMSGYGLIAPDAPVDSLAWVLADASWLSPLRHTLLLLSAAVANAIVHANFKLTADRALRFFSFGYGALCVAATVFDWPLPWLLVVSLAVAAIAAWREPFGVQRFVGRPPCLVGLVLMTVAAVGLANQPRAPRWVPSPGAAPSDAISVVVVACTGLRADHTQLSGYSRPTTPGLLRLAQDSVVFKYARAGHPSPVQAIATLLTGAEPAAHGARLGHALGDLPDLATFLGAKGYRTALFAGGVGRWRAAPGLDRGFQRQPQILQSHGWREWIARLWNAPVVERCDGRDVIQVFSEWLERGPRDQPFFTLVELAGTAGPIGRGNAIFDRYSNLPTKARARFRRRWHVAGVNGGMSRSSAETVAAIDAYDAAVSDVSSQVETICDALHARGLYQNTLLVVVGAQGTALGERNEIGDSSSADEALLHVPLCVKLPEQREAGRAVNDAVDVASLPATIVECLGLQGDTVFTGKSLSRHWSAEGSAR